MTKAVRMTVTSTVEITAPLGDVTITKLTDDHRSKIRQDMKRQVIEQAKQSGSKVKSIVVARIDLVDVK